MKYRIRNLSTGNQVGPAYAPPGHQIKIGDKNFFETNDINIAFRCKEKMAPAHTNTSYEVEQYDN